MTTFSTLGFQDYIVEDLYLSAPITWELVSGSNGIVITDPNDLAGAVTVQRASSTPFSFYEGTSADSEYLLYRSIKHIFYDSKEFYSGSKIITSSLAGFPNNSFVISVGQQFYGNEITPGSFRISTELSNTAIIDDQVGNLYISQSGAKVYIGNIFYNKGVAIVKHNTGSAITAIGTSGLQLVSSSQLFISYESDVKLSRHEVYVKIRPSEFNFSALNPSIARTFTPSGSLRGAFTASMKEKNIQPSASSDDTYYLYDLMSAGVIKPYVTSVGLYNERYELLAVAKFSEPIQRTFDTDQIFIVRFNT